VPISSFAFLLKKRIFVRILLRARMLMCAWKNVFPSKFYKATSA
jgi:hypothetical protein